MALRSLSLCSGIGGIDLGLSKWCEPAAFVEIDPFCRGILRRRWPSVPILEDLRELDGHDWSGTVDILVAGFPCQPFSTASRGRRVAENLWPRIARLIDKSRPPTVFLENVQYEPIRRAAWDLHPLGYQGRVAPLSSAQVGAAHDRRRWWLLAHADDAEQPVLSLDAEVAGIQAASRSWVSLPAGLLGVDDGLPNRMDRLRALGNAVVPAQAEAAFAFLGSKLFRMPPA